MAAPLSGGGHRVVVGHRFSSPPGDFLDHQIGGSAVSASAVDRPSQVVHHHPGAAARQFEGVASSQAPSRSGDDRHPLVKCDIRQSKVSCLDERSSRNVLI